MKKTMLLAAAAAILIGAAPPTPPLVFGAQSRQGLVVVYTRIAPGPKVPEPHLLFVPYDPATKTIESRRRDLPGKPFKVGRGAGLWSNADRQNWQGWAVLAEPGTYVAAQATNPNSGGSSNSYARGTLMFEVKPGRALYVGDYSFHLGKWKFPNAGQVAGDFLKGFFTLGLVMPNQPVYSGDVSYDEARAKAYLATRLPQPLELERAPLKYVDFADSSRRAYYLNPTG
jgi:hypothetical protein